MKQSLASRCSKVYRYLPTILILLFCLQPILDILSYWQDALKIPFSLSFVPRMIILVILALGGYVLSERKAPYLLMMGILGVYYACHLYVCYTNGLVSLTTDLATYIRVLQLPVTAICLITCLRCNPDCMEAIQRGILYTMLILALSFLVSTLTGTEPHTYTDKGVGIRGYSFWPNAQSAILSLCAPISIGYVIKKRPDKPLLVTATIVLALSLLFLHATRLSFLCMIITSLGMAIVVFLTRGTPKKYAWILLIATALGGGAYRFSPMYTNQEDVAEYTAVKNTASGALLELGRIQVINGNSPLLQYAGIVQWPDGMEAFALAQPLEECSYNDISASDWRSEYLAYCQSLGVISCYDSKYYFMPEEAMTVIQALTVADNVYEKYHGTVAFADYVGDSWYDVYLKRAEAYGFALEGVTDYEAPLTRAQAAKLLYSALDETEFPLVHEVSTVSDVNTQTPYFDEIMALYRAGVMLDPADETRFRPDAPITRGEFAVMLAAVVNPAFRICDEGYALQIPEPVRYDTSRLTPELRKDAVMYPLYTFFCGGLVRRFGIHKTLLSYSYTTNTSVIINERQWKLQYCYMLMDESTPASRLFGLEVTRMFYEGTSYDVENDFHGIYLLYGWVGLALMLLFLLFFIGLIVWALLKNAKRYFTIDSGPVGIALIATLIHAYFTCGVLRRANTLFYLGALLAAIYYLVVIKKYPDEEFAERR